MSDAKWGLLICGTILAIVAIIGLVACVSCSYDHEYRNELMRRGKVRVFVPEHYEIRDIDAKGDK